MQLLPLSRGMFAFVDDDDFARLSRSRWFYKPERPGKQGTAMRHGRNARGKVTTEYLSRLIVNPPAGYDVIHLNHNRLDCRRSNLAVVDKAHAQRHKRVRRDSVSGIKGVRYDKTRRRWIATLWREGVGRHVGAYKTAREAAAAYERAVVRWEEYEAGQRAWLAGTYSEASLAG